MTPKTAADHTALLLALREQRRWLPPHSVARRSITTRIRAIIAAIKAQSPAMWADISSSIKTAEAA